MPDSAVLTFADPDAYHAAIRAPEVQGFITAPGNFHAELTRIDFYRLLMQRGEESLPRILKFATTPERVAIFFAAGPSQPAMQLNGMEMSQRSVIALGLGLARHHRSSAACQWAAMSLTHEDLVAAGLAILGRELTLPTFAHRIRPPAHLLSRLSNLHEAAGHLAKTAPDILTRPEVAQALEERLVQAMVSCMVGGDVPEIRSAHHRHAAVMRRLEELLEANSDRTLYLADLCAATGASDRTLRACCQEHLGMSPMRYLWLRRMHLARRALRIADPATTTVTEVATTYGFWELGRFSGAYRSLFGEAPSAALHRPPDDPRPQKSADSPWHLPESA
jgi:AraC-like DNA-binding protein